MLVSPRPSSTMREERSSDAAAVAAAKQEASAAASRARHAEDAAAAAASAAAAARVNWERLEVEASVAAAAAATAAEEAVEKAEAAVAAEQVETAARAFEIAAPPVLEEGGSRLSANTDTEMDERQSCAPPQRPSATALTEERSRSAPESRVRSDITSRTRAARRAEVAAQQATDFHQRGLGANKHFEYQTAYRMFMKASRLRPTEPAHLISAANMKLKLLRLDDAERLYERAWGMAELTAAQRQMVGEKRLLLRQAGAWGGDFALKAMGVPQKLGPPRSGGSRPALAAASP